MKTLSLLLSLVLTAAILFASIRPAQGCGPSTISSIYVFTESPDLPFEEYISGKIGILQPTFGRKTLFIAYRYLNGDAFTVDEQQQLANALRAESPETETDNTKAIKAWVAQRSEAASQTEKLPAVYTERQYGGYDFFPNCTGNAFEVATETLRDRLGRFGREDAGVREWLTAQDLVFQNCAGGAQIPSELGAESPAWLRKDRDYQIAAAFFYSLNFEEALLRFERIAADADSSWQQTADYLVARTLVRQASLATDEQTKRKAYEKAELHLGKLLSGSGKFFNASRRLLALVKYRIRPQERIRELAGLLMHERGNTNLRQDLIDYTWLLDKFETQVLKEEEERKKTAEQTAEEAPRNDRFINKEVRERYERIESGEVIEITIHEKGKDEQPIYHKGTSLQFKPNVSEAEVRQSFEVAFGRKLTAEETTAIQESYKSAQAHRMYVTNPNRKWDKQRWTDYEGCRWECERLSVDQFPGFVRADELSDWIFTFQTNDSRSYAHAFSRWRATGSPVWFVAALVKAEKTSPGLARLMNEAEKLDRGAPGFATVAYHLVRLKIALGKTDEARTRLDQIISWQTDVLPISSQNQFLEQRMQLATKLDEFLKFSGRRPLAFYYYGQLGKMSDFLKMERESWNESWNPEDSNKTKEEHIQEREEQYQRLLPWDNLTALDEKTIEVLNWHFPLQTWAVAASSPAVPEHLQSRFALAVWTRAILLKDDEVAQQVAPQVNRLVPEIGPVFSSYLTARSAKEREVAALFVLLKSPSLSPFLASDMWSFTTNEDLDYYFESSWWCPLAETTYTYENHESKEVPKIVAPPGFLTPQQIQAARRERQALSAIGSAKAYLSMRVLKWAKEAPEDRRVPEALYISAQANQSYKYGCSSWEQDPLAREAAEELLRKTYPNSPWTGKLDQRQN